jgi:cellobiose epimerase
MNLADLRQQASDELQHILDYWTAHALDHQYGGVKGRIDNNNVVDPRADKGAVLHARVLWTFSAAYNLQQKDAWKTVASTIFRYLSTWFIDLQHGGVYWTVDFTGRAAETKKQVYAQAFVIYALSEYYKATRDEQAKKLAIELYHLLQQYSYDAVKGGYLEAFTKDWQLIEDVRLSAKDANEKKTMNTHLHVVEAYANLYTVWPDASLALQIRQLLNVFYDKIIDHKTGHLHLFFDEDWQVKGDLISYGHDIEASWLLPEAAEIIRDASFIEKYRKLALNMTEAVMPGIDADGGLWYEYEPAHQTLIKEKHWWPQAEAVVGFINAWQISGEQRYADYALRNWQFINRHIIDKQKGEWFWGVKEDYSIMQEDKVGLWKCPYHNGRACLEIIKRI